MKFIVIFCLFSSCLLACSSDSQHETKITDDYISVHFDDSYTQADLDKLKEDLKSNQVEITYFKTAFDDAGKLKAITFRVKCQNKYSGSASQENLSSRSGCGFYWDRTNSTEKPFGTYSN